MPQIHLTDLSVRSLKGSDSNPKYFDTKTPGFGIRCGLKRKTWVVKGMQQAILNFLTLKGIFHWRQNSGSFKTERGGFYSFGLAGAPDIFCVMPPTCQLLGIEVKDVRGRLNPSQVDFKHRLEMAGADIWLQSPQNDVLPLFIN